MSPIVDALMSHWSLMPRCVLAVSLASTTGFEMGEERQFRSLQKLFDFDR